MATLTNDGVLAVCDVLGIQTLPVVLAVGPRQDSFAEFTAARDAALTRLRAHDLLDQYGDVDADLGAALHVLGRPERELAVRIVTETGTRRICLARRGAVHAVGIRQGDEVEIATEWSDGGGEALVRPVLAALGPCPPADIPSFSAPADELAARFDTAREAAEFTRVLNELGITDKSATDFGIAMAGCRARAEIVGLAHEDGITTRTSGAVAVYDTVRGRIAASPGAATDSRVWTTFTPGSDHRVAQAVAALIETLPGGRWMP